MAKKKITCPTKYKETFPEDIVEYYRLQMDNFEVGKKYVLPTLLKWALRNKLCSDSVETYKRRYPEFKKAVKICNGIQKDFLVSGAVDNTHNASFTKFLLSCNHGMKETTHVEHSGKLTLESLISESFEDEE